MDCKWVCQILEPKNQVKSWTARYRALTADSQRCNPGPRSATYPTFNFERLLRRIFSGSSWLEADNQFYRQRPSKSYGLAL
jgi:hypothetical protein